MLRHNRDLFADVLFEQTKILHNLGGIRRLKGKYPLQHVG